MASTSGIASPTDVHTSYGICRGKITKSGLHLWQGIPYATVPQRFSHSIRSNPWEGVRDCTRYGKQAVQPTLQMMLDGTRLSVLANAFRAPSAADELPKSMSEQCLHLDIRAPAPTKTLLPVMVFIHGGAFVFGSGAQAIYHCQGGGLPEQGVVLVTINYRLGSFGYLKLPGCDANCGLGDQCMALQWVHEEIRHFGGDPANVTIFGESAGGMSCGALLACPQAQPFFKNAILMSGAMSNAISSSDAAAIGQRFCHMAGLSAEQLRDIRSEELLALQVKFAKAEKLGAMRYQPCVDGVLLLAPPLEAVTSGAVDLSGKHVMLGSTQAEWSLFSPSFLEWMRWRKSSLSGLSHRIAKSLDGEMESIFINDSDGGADVDQIRSLFKAIRNEQKLSSWDATQKSLLTMLVFTAPARLAARVLSERAASVWVYEYGFEAGMLGACHAAELPVLFGTFDQHWSLERFSGYRNDPSGTKKVSEAMAATFTSFAKTGSPSSATDSWSQYSSSSPCVYVFDSVSGPVHENAAPDSALNQAVVAVKAQGRPFGVRLNDRPVSKL